MVRSKIANVWSDQNIDDIFQRTADRQKEGEFQFSTVVNLLDLAVFKIMLSLHSAYKSRSQEVGCSIAAIYNKLAGAELGVSRQIVKQTADSMREIYDALSTPGRVILPGYDVGALDGSHLRATERRLDVSRMINGRHCKVNPGSTRSTASAHPRHVSR